MFEMLRMNEIDCVAESNEVQYCILILVEYVVPIVVWLHIRQATNVL